MFKKNVVTENIIIVLNKIRLMEYFLSIETANISKR